MRPHVTAQLGHDPADVFSAFDWTPIASASISQVYRAALADGTPVDGKTIEELGIPRDATVVAVLRKERLIVPRGDTLLRAGDEVIVLVTAESEDEVNRLLTGAPTGAG